MRAMDLPAPAKYLQQNPAQNQGCYIGSPKKNHIADPGFVHVMDFALYTVILGQHSIRQGFYLSKKQNVSL